MNDENIRDESKYGDYEGVVPRPERKVSIIFIECWRLVITGRNFF